MKGTRARMRYPRYRVIETENPPSPFVCVCVWYLCAARFFRESAPGEKHAEVEK